jgi:DNA-binding transcriptional LysR family regulator
VGPLYRWEFEKGGRPLTISVSGSLIVDDVPTMIAAALDGVGLAYVMDATVIDHVKSGRLVRVLEDWCPPFPGFFLSRRQTSPTLQALIQLLR